MNVQGRTNSNSNQELGQQNHTETISAAECGQETWEVNIFNYEVFSLNPES